MTTPKLRTLALTVMLGLGLVPVARADFHEPPPPKPVHVDANGLTWTIDFAGPHAVAVPVAIHLDDNGILHVQYGAAATTPALVLDPDRKSTHASVRVSETAGVVTMTSDRLTATWNKNATLSVTDAHGRLLLTLYPLSAGEGKVSLMHAIDDPMYGISGFDAFEKDTSAGLLRKGKQIAKAGEQGHPGAPFVWSTAGYGVLYASDRNVDFNEVLPTGHPDADPHLAQLDIAEEVAAKSTNPSMDFYILVGTPPQLFGELADLSGHAPMFPKWANGFINSQWGIDEPEFRSIVAGYRARHIPLDAFTFDFDWKDWGKDWGEYRWNATKFPDGPTGGLKADMDALGVHMTGIMKPRVHVDTVEGRYATAHDLWLPGEKASPDYFSHLPVKDIDFDKPESRAWWFNDHLKHSLDTGIVGWWNDEADTTKSNTQFLNMQRATYDGQRAYSKLRVWSINRDFWLGAQRYAYGLWSGDIPTGFASMAGQRERMLSAIAVGVTQWGMDGGGFHGHPSDENYARWIEFGAFTPIFRVHGELDEKRQPWRYGPVAEAAATKATRLRYALLPYIYAYQHRASEQGVGLVQPLNFVWPDDAKLRNDAEAWLFGDWLLVSPVVAQGQASKQVYLPAGTWTDWFSGKDYAGDQTITIPVDAKTWTDIPLFIRDGAIIPTQPVMDWTGEHPVTTISVDAFPSHQATHFDYYDDDGETYAYQHGAYFKQRLSTQNQGRVVSFGIGAPTGSYRPALRHWLVRVHGLIARAVTSSGQALPEAKSVSTLETRDREGWSNGNDRFGPYTLIRLDAGAARELRLDPLPIP